MPYGHENGIHVLHMCLCVVEALARGVAPTLAPLPLLTAGGGGVGHTRRRAALKAAVQADPGLRVRAARMGGV